jgi:hypothetical protein
LPGGRPSVAPERKSDAAIVAVARLPEPDTRSARDLVEDAGFLWRNFPMHVEAALMRGDEVEQIAVRMGVPVWVVARTAAELMPIPTHSETAGRTRGRFGADG